MNKYEVLYIIEDGTAENVREEIIARFEQLVSTNGGSVDSLDKWGTKRFAYPIHFKNDGFYVLMNFSSAPEFVAELRRQMKNTEAIVREMVIRKDA